MADSTLQPNMLSGLHRECPEVRLQKLISHIPNLGTADVVSEQGTLQSLSTEQADRMVENALGIYALPYAVATNYLINDEPVLIPMAVEEASIVAASSHFAKLVQQSGGFMAQAHASIMEGQIQLVGIHLDDVAPLLERHKSDWIKIANSFCASLVLRGGGVIDIRAYEPERPKAHYHQDWGDATESMTVLALSIDCRDAMGANLVNTVCEGLSLELTSSFPDAVCLRILSNLCDKRLAKARFELDLHLLLGADEAHDTERARQVGKRFIQAYELAVRDPYRACTHNKGIANGIEAVAVATGNDWRAIGAACHAYAARSGQYTSLTRYRLDLEHNTLIGEIEVPIAVGVVGGIHDIHPTLKASKAMLGSFGEHAQQLAMVLATVGLSQNAAALKALVTTGIQKGHMALHAYNIALRAGVSRACLEDVVTLMRTEEVFTVEFAQSCYARLQKQAD